MTMFETARTNASGSKTKTVKATDPNAVSITDLRELAIVSAAIKSLEGMKETLSASVNDQILDRFVEIHDGSKPKNFVGSDTDTTASCQLRKRSSRSNLSDSDIDLLKKVGVSFEESVSTMFFINKTHAANADLLKQVSDALEKVDGIPADFIQSTPEKYVTTDKSLDEAFGADLSDDDLRNLLKVVGVIGKRTKFNGDINDVMKNVASLMGA